MCVHVPGPTYTSFKRAKSPVLYSIRFYYLDTSDDTMSACLGRHSVGHDMG